MQIATFFCHNEVSDIPVTTGGVALPGGSAFMPVGVYVVNGISYDCTRQGLYRWFNPIGQFINRIVFNTASLDVYAIISGVSWNHVHGIQTEYGMTSANYQTMSNVGRYRKWSARCGYIAGMVAWLMPQFGVQARVKNVKTLQANNGYDDGHLIVETLHGTDWRMWDITNGCYFKDANGKHLSCADFMSWLSANPAGLPDIVKLDGDSKYTNDVVTLPNTGILDLGLYWERTYATQADIEAWYRRIFQAYA